MKCCNSAFDAHGLRIIIVVVQIGAMKKMYSSSEGAQGKGKTG
jgi:hypothetical protein